MTVERVCIKTNYGSLGDRLCLIAAARRYSKEHPNQEVFVDTAQDLRSVIEAYGDQSVKYGRFGRMIECDPGSRQRTRSCGESDFNYLGTYMAELGLKFNAPPTLELPFVEPPQGLPIGGYVCLQPSSGYCGSIGNAAISELVMAVRSTDPLMPVIIVGSRSTAQGISGVSYEHLGDPMDMLGCIRHAAFVLTPRSASAHIAAAYGTPAFIWSPDDDESWHLNYPGFTHKIVSMASTIKSIRDRFIGWRAFL